ncbi:MAG: YdiU family protein [Alphaproteobacteria bacterium]|nr:YdiU family protein [Alphaproteobacteria bacterium]
MLNNTQRRFGNLPETFYSALSSQPFAHPHLVAFSEPAAALIGLDASAQNHPDFISTFTGEKPVEGFQPYAAVYSGHQFGGYVPQLGDGRALTIGEANGWEIQLKGSGLTPYSRFGDGRAVLRSCIREYLCSEAMAALGIPTTRALCIIGSDEPVRREQVERAAMMTRLSPSHIRFGSFEYFAHTNQHEALQQLVDFTIEHHFPAFKGDEAGWYTEVVERTARLIADWQLVGFTHGVLNTDNMSILGITLDYGPFAFMEAFDAGFTPNHSDEGGRYAFEQQPAVGMWNLNMLAVALSPLLSSDALKEGLRRYEPAFLARFEAGMRAKLGLAESLPEDRMLMRDTIQLLHKTRMDYTRFFRALPDDASTLFKDEHQAEYAEWAKKYAARLTQENRNAQQRKAAMHTVNPKYILRTHLAEAAIRKAEDEQDFSEIDKLRRILKNPFDEQPEYADYALPPADDAPEICLSCSS